MRKRKYPTKRQFDRACRVIQAVMADCFSDLDDIQDRYWRALEGDPEALKFFGLAPGFAEEVVDD